MLITLRGQEGGGKIYLWGKGGVGVRRRFVGRGFFVRARVQLLPELIIRANPGRQFILSVNKEGKFLKNCGAPSVGEYNRVI